MSGRITQNKQFPFSQISNEVLRDENLSLKAKGLYSLIQSYITIPGFVLYKQTLMNVCRESKNTFDTIWKELKDNGYLIQNKVKNKEGKFEYEYELCFEKTIVEVEENKKTTTQKSIPGKTSAWKSGSFNNTDLNNTKYNNTHTPSAQEKNEIENLKTDDCKTKEIEKDILIEDVLQKYHSLKLKAYKFIPNELIKQAIKELGLSTVIKALEKIAESKMKDSLTIDIIFKTINLKKALNGTFDNFETKTKGGNENGSKSKKYSGNNKNKQSAKTDFGGKWDKFWD